MTRHLLIQRAMRNRLLSLPVASTSGVNLSGISGGYSRASGSFLADGYAIGQEVVVTGFTAAALNGAKVVTGVTANTLLVAGGGAVESSASGRTITCGLPTRRAWEGLEFTPTEGAPYVSELYLGGPQTVITVQALGGEIEATPIYQVTIRARSGVGVDALAAYADALLAHFPPGLTLALSDGNTVRVRADTAPYRTTLVLDSPGWSALSVAIPLRSYTTT